MHNSIMLVLLSALAGAIHVMAPDHWVPTSILSWQRRWRAPQTVAFVAAAMSAHIFLGVVLYFVLEDVLHALDPSYLFSFTLIFVLLVMMVRAYRYSRIRDVQRLGPNNWWAMVAVLSLLGPCESIIPIFIKSSTLGLGYLLPLSAFFLGTVSAGTVMVLGGKFVCNRPLWLTRAFTRINQRVAVLPVVAGVALGLRYLLLLN